MHTMPAYVCRGIRRLRMGSERHAAPHYLELWVCDCQTLGLMATDRNVAPGVQAYQTMRKGNRKFAVFDLSLTLEWEGHWLEGDRRVRPKLIRIKGPSFILIFLGFMCYHEVRVLRSLMPDALVEGHWLEVSRTSLGFMATCGFRSYEGFYGTYTLKV